MSPPTFIGTASLVLVLLAQPILGIRDEDAQELLSQDMSEVEQMESDDVLAGRRRGRRRSSSRRRRTSAPFHEAATCYTKSVNYVGGQMKGQGRSEEGDAANCQQRCKNTADCAFFTWWPDRGCHLAHAGARMEKVSQSTVAGARDCRPGVVPDCFNLNTGYSPDMPGEGRTQVASPSKCYDRCKSTPGCYYFSWWEDGGCHLQSRGAQMKWAGKVVSGPAGNCVKCVEPGVQYGPDMAFTALYRHQRTLEFTQDRCQMRCARTPGCKYFTFWEDGGCHIHGSDAKKMENRRAVAGPASCAP